MPPFLLSFPPVAREFQWLFVPTDKRASYDTARDYVHCMRQQPIIVDGEPERLPDYLNPLKGIDRNQEVQQPNLFFGWRIDVHKALKIVERDFEDCLVYRYDTEERLNSIKDVDYEDVEDEDEESKPRVKGIHIHATFLGKNKLWLAMIARAQIDSRSVKLCKFTTFADETGIEQLGLSVGTNYDGVLNPATRERIGGLFELDKSDANWYLDPELWFWFKTNPPTNDGSDDVYIPTVSRD